MKKLFIVGFIFTTSCWKLPESPINSNEITLKIDFAEIKGGNFQMGSTEEGIKNEQPVHEVEVNDFYLSKYETTQEQYLDIIGVNPSERKCKNCPVENVSWFQAVIFCNKLSEKENKQAYYNIQIKLLNNEEYPEITINNSANGYRLPTEAEWEYAAGGGSINRSRYGNGKNIANSNEINYNSAIISNNNVIGINRNSILPVGTFFSNKLGLFDMSGNVSEWCYDWYHEDFYLKSPKSNPTGPTYINNTYYLKTTRGGDFQTSARNIRIYSRGYPNWWEVKNTIGFRVAKNI